MGRMDANQAVSVNSRGTSLSPVRTKKNGMVGARDDSPGFIRKGKRRKRKKSKNKKRCEKKEREGYIDSRSQQALSLFLGYPEAPLNSHVMLQPSYYIPHTHCWRHTYWTTDVHARSDCTATRAHIHAALSRADTHARTHTHTHIHARTLGEHWETREPEFLILMACASETTVALWIVSCLCVCLCVVMFSCRFLIPPPFRSFFSVAAFAVGRTRSCRVLRSAFRARSWSPVIGCPLFPRSCSEHACVKKSIGSQKAICYAQPMRKFAGKGSKIREKNDTLGAPLCPLVSYYIRYNNSAIKLRNYTLTGTYARGRRLMKNSRNSITVASYLIYSRLLCKPYII